jgi:hypothetical protein
MLSSKAFNQFALIQVVLIKHFEALAIALSLRGAVSNSILRSDLKERGEDSIFAKGQLNAATHLISNHERVIHSSKDRVSAAEAEKHLGGLLWAKRLSLYNT